MKVNFIGLGQQIRKYRGLRQVTLDDLAEQTGISVQYMSSIERGTRNISIGMLVRIALALNVSIDELLYDTLSMPDTYYNFAPPEDCFEIIRKALDRLEAEIRGTDIG